MLSSTTKPGEMRGVVGVAQELDELEKILITASFVWKNSPLRTLNLVLFLTFIEKSPLDFFPRCGDRTTRRSPLQSSQ